MTAGNIAWPTKEEIRAMSTERLLSETHKAIDATIRWHGMVRSCHGCSGHPKNEGAEKVYLHYREVVDQMLDALAEQAPGTLPNHLGDTMSTSIRSKPGTPRVALFTQTRAEVLASIPRMTPGPWHIAQNGAQVDVYSRITPKDERQHTVAVAQNVRTDADAEAIAYLPDLINNGRVVVASLMRLFKHRTVMEIPEAASLLISAELAELHRILATVKM